MATKTIEENINQAVADFKAIRAKVVENGIEVPSNTPTSLYADKVDEVYNKGVSDGEKSEYDRFWDSIGTHIYGSTYCFAGTAWNNTTFKPNHSIFFHSNALGLFYANGYIGDLVELCETLDITIDLSDCTTLNEAFAYSKFTRLGTIDFSNIPKIVGVFKRMSNLVKIDKIILKETTPIDGAFIGTAALKDLTIEGTIGQNGFNLSWSKLLSKDSIISVVNALSATTTGLTVTLSLTAVNTAFETSEGAADGSTSQEWLDLAATKSNWTISLIDS